MSRIEQQKKQGHSPSMPLCTSVIPSEDQSASSSHPQQGAMLEIQEVLGALEEFKVRFISGIGELVYLQVRLESIKEQLVAAASSSSTSSGELSKALVVREKSTSSTKVPEVEQSVSPSHGRKVSIKKQTSKAQLNHPSPITPVIERPLSSPNHQAIDRSDQTISAFIKVLQQLQRDAEGGNVQFGLVAFELSKVDPDAMDRLGVKKFSDVLVIMQESLDLVIEVGARRGAECLRFRDIDCPWLPYRRPSLPPFKEQIDRMMKKRDGHTGRRLLQVKISDEHFDPLIEALDRHYELGGMPYSALKVFLPRLESDIFEKSGCRTFKSYIARAKEVCNIEINRLGRDHDPIARLSDRNHPFKTESQNEAFKKRTFSPFSIRGKVTLTT